MSDSGFREIQLSGKHVVFLFMAGAVAAVAIFLLGVSVGRGVAKPETAAQATPPPTEPAPGAGQSADQQSTTPKPGELNYHEALLGKDAKGGAPAQTPAASPAAPAKAAATPAPTSTPSPKPAAKPDAKAPAPAGGQYYVQVNAFNSLNNANKEMANLKAKGLTGILDDAAGGAGPRYKVKVGPYSKAAADAMKARLRKEGFPSATVIR